MLGAIIIDTYVHRTYVQSCGAAQQIYDFHTLMLHDQWARDVTLHMVQDIVTN